MFWEGFATDVTDRRLAQEMLAREHGRLEQLVRDKSIELETSHEQLRLSERLAGLGTLSAGLGHDIGNLLLPMRIHLDNLKQLPLADAALNEVESVSECCEYLNRLASGLKLLAVGSSQAGLELVELREWWAEAEPLLRSSLPRSVNLVHALPEDGCRVAVAKTATTQAVFNLVQNAGDALATRARGTVRVTAERGPGDKVTITVSDDGPGMPPDIARRCLEPFFTTKPRGRSTGLGLALVRSLVTDAGGEILVESEVGRGTTFSLVLPAARADQMTNESNQGEICIEVGDPRLRAIIANEARGLFLRVVHDFSPAAPMSVHVMDRESLPRAARRVLFVGVQNDAPPEARVVPPNAKSKDIRDAVRQAITQAC